MPPPTKPSKRKEVAKDAAATLKYLENKKKDKTHLDHMKHFFITHAQMFKTFSPRTQA